MEQVPVKAKTIQEKASVVGGAKPLSKQELMRQKVQQQLNKQFKADKKAEREKKERLKKEEAVS